jgi:hypothetical protein
LRVYHFRMPGLTRNFRPYLFFQDGIWNVGVQNQGTDFLEQILGARQDLTRIRMVDRPPPGFARGMDQGGSVASHPTGGGRAETGARQKDKQPIHGLKIPF